MSLVLPLCPTRGCSHGDLFCPPLHSDTRRDALSHVVWYVCGCARAACRNCDKKMVSLLVRTARAARVAIGSHLRSRNRYGATALMQVCAVVPILGLSGEDVGLIRLEDDDDIILDEALEVCACGGSVLCVVGLWATCVAWCNLLCEWVRVISSVVVCLCLAHDCCLFSRVPRLAASGNVEEHSVAGSADGSPGTGCGGGWWWWW